MTQRKRAVLWAGIVTAILLLAVPIFSAVAGTSGASPADAPGVGAIVIDAAAQYGELEQPGVVFDHDKHTDALTKMAKDCTSCHVETEGQLSFKYERIEDPRSKQTLVELYHTKCADCHDKVSGDYPKAPQTAECKGCHVGDAVEGATLTPRPSLDLNLHGRHVVAEAKVLEVPEEETCKACHHKYDAEQKKLVYAKGEEGNCLYCHKTEPMPMEGEEDRFVPTTRDASHESCVNCHVSTKKTQAETGPVLCKDCHAPTASSQWKRTEETPRLMRGQSDAILLVAGPTTPEGEKDINWASAGPGPVAFDHKSHEVYVGNCISCHHATATGGSLAACGLQCHTTTGDEKGAYITAAQAAHQADALASCVGCHNVQTTYRKECAGCHSLLDKTKLSEGSCVTCHETGFPTSGKEKMPKAEREAKAKDILAAKTHDPQFVPFEEVPEVMKLNYMDHEGDEWEAAEFPHRKIYQKLVEEAAKSPLANHFHNDALTMCAACHHHSTPSLNPPKCASCHAKPFQERTANQPGLKGAFHLQCIGCHQEMQVPPKATDCAGCHKPKNADAAQ